MKTKTLLYKKGFFTLKQEGYHPIVRRTFLRKLDLTAFITTRASFRTENNLFSIKIPIKTQHLLVQSQQRKHQSNVRKMFKVNNKDIRKSVNVVLMSLLLTLNMLHTLFLCFR